ncbi:MAG: HAMP domain-containing histidine kinase, partial [Halobacteriales archaeon]|nr:HAMP domain-containing histidine kinase [Halobacteriales archaeon]
PLFDAEGTLQGYAKVTRDLTASRAAEAARIAEAVQGERLQEAQQREVFRAQFVNAAAHELRTPLTPLRLQVDLLRSQLGRFPDPRIERSLAILDRNLHRLSRLVDDLLMLSRLEAGKLVLEMEDCDVEVFVQHAAEAFRPLADEAGVAFVADIAPGLRVRADPTRLGQVLDNLASNAVKYTPRGGRVTVRARPEGAAVRIEVRDTGVGIKPADLERLFQPFTQLGRAPRLDAGHGLGLYVVRSFVRVMGGEVGVASDGPGKGATFWVTLPAA